MLLALPRASAIRPGVAHEIAALCAARWPAGPPLRFRPGGGTSRTSRDGDRPASDRGTERVPQGARAGAQGGKSTPSGREEGRGGRPVGKGTGPRAEGARAIPRGGGQISGGARTTPRVAGGLPGRADS